MLGTWLGRRIVNHINDRIFVLLVEIGLLAAGVLLITGYGQDVVLSH